jgi:hypothetical protein
MHCYRSLRGSGGGQPDLPGGGHAECPWRPVLLLGVTPVHGRDAHVAAVRRAREIRGYVGVKRADRLVRGVSIRAQVSRSVSYGHLHSKAALWYADPADTGWLDDLTVERPFPVPGPAR